MKKTYTALLAAASLFALAQAASAADLARPIYKAPPAAIPVWNWTGFYVGGNIGGAWSTTDVTGPFGGTASVDNSGFIGGGQAGYNYQFAPSWLVGIEGEIDWTSNSASRTVGGVTLTADPNWVAAVSGRIGYVGGPWLLYGKGGAAWMDVDYTASAGALSVTNSQTRDGWLAGVGLEYMFHPNWTAKIEYDYMDFGSANLATTLGVNVDTTINVVKGGINYKF